MVYMKVIKEKIKKNIFIKKIYIFFIKRLSNFIYFLNRRQNRIKVYSIERTFDELLNSRVSMVRFGDGEMSIIDGENIKFQKFDEELSKRLKVVLQSRLDNLIICIPDVFNSLNAYNKDVQEFWKRNLLFSRKKWYTLLNNNVYYNSFITRFYSAYSDKTNINKMFDKFKLLYKDRECILVEGKYSRLGYNNDLFDNTKSLKRILCPTQNAFTKYNEILDCVKKQPKNKLILVSLGPTAKILVYDLSLLGYQVLDIGHIDAQYEWFNMKANGKVNIKNKYVSETENNELDEIDDLTYKKQIIKEIK